MHVLHNLPHYIVFTAQAWYCNEYWNPTGLTAKTGAKIYSVKLMGWYWADGINAGQYGTVSFSFVKVNDDGIKPFYTGSEVENSVIWQQHNGWAIMLSWLTGADQDNISVHDIWILHDGHADCGANCDFPVAGSTGNINSQATIGAVHGGSAKITNVHLNRIYMETPVWRPFFLGIQKSDWGKDGTGKSAFCVFSLFGRFV